MTLEDWLVRLRMMARSSVVELSPGEVADLVVAIGQNTVVEEREACARIADFFHSPTGRNPMNPDAQAQMRVAGYIARDIRKRR